MTIIKPQYLGDGVYVSDDGYQLWLAVGEHTNNVVALEPAILLSLIEHGARFLKEIAPKGDLLKFLADLSTEVGKEATDGPQGS